MVVHSGRLFMQRSFSDGLIAVQDGVVRHQMETKKLEMKVPAGKPNTLPTAWKSQTTVQARRPWWADTVINQADVVYTPSRDQP